MKKQEHDKNRSKKSCLVATCKSGTKHEYLPENIDKIRYHRVPVDVKRARLWLKLSARADRRKETKPRKFDKICCLHFCVQQYSANIKKSCINRNRLKKDAVPCQNLPRKGKCYCNKKTPDLSQIKKLKKESPIVRKKTDGRKERASKSRFKSEPCTSVQLLPQNVTRLQKIAPATDCKPTIPYRPLNPSLFKYSMPNIVRKILPKPDGIAPTTNSTSSITITSPIQTVVTEPSISKSSITPPLKTVVAKPKIKTIPYNLPSDDSNSTVSSFEVPLQYMEKKETQVFSPLPIRPKIVPKIKRKKVFQVYNPFKQLEYSKIPVKKHSGMLCTDSLVIRRDKEKLPVTNATKSVSKKPLMSSELFSLEKSVNETAKSPTLSPNEKSDMYLFSCKYLIDLKVQLVNAETEISNLKKQVIQLSKEKQRGGQFSRVSELVSKREKDELSKDLEYYRSVAELHFSDAQLSRMSVSRMNKKIKLKQWTEEDLLSATTLYKVSKKSYWYVRKIMNIPLPSLATIKRYKKDNFNEGILEANCVLLEAELKEKIYKKKKNKPSFVLMENVVEKNRLSDDNGGDSDDSEIMDRNDREIMDRDNIPIMDRNDREIMDRNGSPIMDKYNSLKEEVVGCPNIKLECDNDDCMVHTLSIDESFMDH